MKFLDNLVAATIILFFITSCSKGYYIGGLDICNDSDIELLIESNIKSELYDGLMQFNLSPGKENAKSIASSKRSEDRMQCYPISSLVYNQDAYIKLYKKHISGEYSLLKEWKFLDRIHEDRNPFNESCLEVDSWHQVDGGNFFVMTFHVMPSDINE